MCDVSSWCRVPSVPCRSRASGPILPTSRGPVTRRPVPRQTILISRYMTSRDFERVALPTLDRSGAAVAYVADHLSHPRMAGRWVGDGPSLLGAVAASTRRLDLGPLVS